MFLSSVWHGNLSYKQCIEELGNLRIEKEKCKLVGVVFRFGQGRVVEKLLVFIQKIYKIFSYKTIKIENLHPMRVKELVFVGAGGMRGVFIKLQVWVTNILALRPIVQSPWLKIS